MRLVERCRVGGYREFAPPPGFETVLEGVWIHRSPSASEASGRGEESTHRVIPHFGTSVTLERRLSREGELEQAALLFLGPVSTPRLFRLEPGHEMLSLRLRPELCQPLLGVEVGELWNAIVPYEALSPRGSQELGGLLSHAGTDEQLLGLLLSWLARRTAAVPSRAAARLETSCTVIEHLRRHHGAVPVDALVREHGRSPQYMRRVLRQSLGTTPKRIACLLRLNAAIAQADAVANPAWADLAARFGYSDQAHLVRETRRWTGVSPTVLHAERRAELDPFPPSVSGWP